MQIRKPDISRPLLAMAFLSGMCALVYQVYWIRELRLILGSTTPATASVLAVFMGGLGIGSLLLGPRADRSPRPVRFYAVLELAITAGAAMSPLMIRASGWAYDTHLSGAAGGGVAATAIRAGLAIIVLLLPAVAMGGTLPVLGRAIEDEDDPRRGRWGLLYGVNTLGAIVGAALPTLVLFEHWGALRTLLAACGVNALLTGAAFLLASREAPVAPCDAAVDSSPEGERPGRTGLVYPAAFLAGFAFFLAEIVWYRMLSPILGGTTYTFGLILVAVLAGIGTGGLAWPILRTRWAPSLGLLALVSALEALALAAPFAAGDGVALTAGLLGAARPFGFAALSAGWMAVAAFVVIPAAFFSGIQFPLLLAFAGRGRASVGTHAGFVTASNMAGAVAGSLLGGFVLLPGLGAPACWRLASAACILLAGLFGISAAGRERGAVRAALGTAALAGILLTAAGPTAVWRHAGIGIGNFPTGATAHREVAQWARNARTGIIREYEGREASVAILGREGLAFSVNGKIDGNAVGDAPTQVMLGLLGALFHTGEPRRAFVIGLGTGSTAGWLAAVDSIERVDVAEIEPSIVEFARMCAAVNRNAMDNPKVRVRIADGLEAVRTARERYDLVVSEPSNPYRAGIASLYTRDFYRVAAGRMNDGAIFVQWLQTYDIDAETLWTILSTLRSVFRHVEVWQTLGGLDLAILASDAPPLRDGALLRERIASGPYREALSSTWQVEDLEGVLGRHLAGPALADLLPRDPRWRPDTQDRNRIEYGFARAVSASRTSLVAGLVQVADVLKAGRPDIAGSVDWARVDLNRGLTLVAGNLSPAGLVEDADREGRLAAFAAWTRNHDTATCASRWPVGKREPANGLERIAVADSLADQGRGEAAAFLKPLLTDHPVDAELIRARLLWRTGRPDEATEALCRGFEKMRSHPWVNGSILGRALREMAPGLGKGVPRRGQRIANALAEPFAAYVLNSERLAAIARTTPVAPQAAGALEAFEPDFPWEEDLLELRESAYRSAGHPLAAKAFEELARYRQDERGDLYHSFFPDRHPGKY